MTLLQALGAYFVAAALLTMTPGLDTALVLRTAASEGRRAAWQAAIGIGGGCVAWGIIAAVGLGSILLASPAFYEALKLAGALYLIWLGAAMLRRSLRAPAPSMHDIPHDAGAGWLTRGFVNNLLNPKVGLFYIAFLPQFVPDGFAPAPFMVLLALIHFALGLAWSGLLIVSVDRASAVLRRPRVQRLFDGATGVVFASFGAALVLDRRS